MLKKLLKYDLIWINKFMLIYFSITFIVSILTRIMSNFTSTFFGNIIFLVLRGVAISCFASTLINCVIRIWVRFKTSIYKDESYLTHTLPVSRNLLYNSKVLSSIVSLVLSLIVITINFLIVFLNQDFIKYIKTMVGDSKFILIGLIVTTILETSYMLFCGLLGIILGHKSNNHRNVKSVFIGIVLYFTLQTIILGIIYIIGLTNNELNALFTVSTDIILPSSMKTLLIITDTIYLVFLTMMYFVGRMTFKKGVNVE